MCEPKKIHKTNIFVWTDNKVELMPNVTLQNKDIKTPKKLTGSLVIQNIETPWRGFNTVSHQMAVHNSIKFPGQGKVLLKLRQKKHFLRQ